MKKRICKILEDKFDVEIEDLLYPNRLNTIVNPVIKGTNKRQIYYSLNKKQDNIILNYGSWLHTDNEGSPKKFFTVLEGELPDNMQGDAPKRDVNKLKYVFKSGTNVITPYVKRKDIKMFSAVNVKNDTLVPIFKDDSFIGFQSIKENGEKRFVVSEKLKGAFSVIQETDDNSIVYVVEGFSTGASVALAMPSTTVVSALSLSNMLTVARNLKQEYSDKIVMCILDKPNNEQVSKVNNELKKEFTCIEPNFYDKSGTDMNDLHIEFGLEEVKKQILNLQASSPTFKPIPMGYDEGFYYIYSQRLSDILKFPRHGSIQGIALSLSPLKFWELNFKGNAKNMSTNHWNVATDAYIQLCIEKGWFDNSRLRGLGVYRDDDRIIFNDGSKLYLINGGLEYVTRNNLKSDYRYTFSSATIGDVTKTSPLKHQELKELTRAVYSFDWKHKNNSIILLGWIVQAVYSGLSDWRSHIWLVGDTSTGKSFIKDNVFDKLIPFRRKASGMTSMAGVLQEISPHGLPFVHEECEPEDRKSSELITEILKMHRVSSSSRTESINRGTPSGVPIKYAVRHSTCNISINSYLPQQQDRERFMVLELVYNPNSNYKKGAEFFKGISDNYYKRFLVYLLQLKIIEMYEHYYKDTLKYLETFQKFKNLTLHVKRCTASITAGFGILRPDIKIKALATTLSETIPQYNMKNTVNLTEKEDFTHKFLTFICPDKWNVGKGVTFVDAVLLNANERLFTSMGIRLDKHKEHILIYRNSPAIRQLFVENQCFPIMSTITNIREFDKLPVTVSRIGGKSWRCLKIPIKDYIITKKK